MKKKSKIIVSLVLVILIVITILIISPISKRLEDIFNQGREVVLEDGEGLLALDPGGQPWVVASRRDGKKNEIEVRTLKDGGWKSFTSSMNGLPYDAVKSMAADHRGNIWIGTWRSGLLKYDGKKWTTFTSKNSGLSTNDIQDIEVDSLNRIWICYGRTPSEHLKGVTVYDGENWSTFTTRNSDILSDEVEAIAIDPEGRTWMGMRGDITGVSILDDDEWISYTPKDSRLKADAIGDIAIDGDGRAWIVTYGDVQGINILDGETWEFFDPGDLGVLEREWLIPGIHIDQYQRIWISSGFFRGARIYDGQKWVGFIREDGSPRGISDLADDDQGRVWITSEGELFTINQDYPLTGLWEARQIRALFTRGWTWYAIVVLACMLAAVLLDPTSPLAVALLASVLATTGWSILAHEPKLFYGMPFVHPGLFISAGAMIGGMIGQWNKTIRKKAGVKKYVPLIAGFFIGLAIGFCQIMPYLFMQ